MANDGSFGSKDASNVFDFNSQKGVANILASVRASTISPAQKNEIRDLIFQYMNGGMDQTVRISLEQKLVGSNIAPVAPSNPVAEKKAPAQYSFGTSRPAPSFPVSNPISTKKIVAPEPKQEAPKVQEPEPEKQSYTEPSPVHTPPKTAPVSPTPTPTPAPETVNEPQPAESPVLQATEPETVMDPAQGLQRIKEIKSLVNEKIGNPVNLVDINNDVGREYMSAMLDAMKKLNTGSSAVSAMKRLEDAYAMVEKTLSEHQDNPAAEEVAPNTPEVTAPQSPVMSSEFVPELQTESEETLESNTPEVWAQQSSVEPLSIPDTAPEVAREEVKDNEPEPKILNTDEWSAEKTEEPKEIIQEENLQESSWSSQPETQPATDGRAHSLAEANVKLRKPEDLPLSSSIETSSVSGDPLYTREVDEGLQQLLSEWPIFKKSGLFGTGPKGREHPLFVKVASLQIPLLLAGRFEGATQEIKQSITDYMNGWRYEQGIIYEHGENFEHYLRRVIRHIIDLQNRKRTP